MAPFWDGFISGIVVWIAAQFVIGVGGALFVHWLLAEQPGGPGDD